MIDISVNEFYLTREVWWYRFFFHKYTLDHVPFIFFYSVDFYFLVMLECFGVSKWFVNIYIVFFEKVLDKIELKIGVLKFKNLEKHNYGWDVTYYYGWLLAHI
jgi:hypothetical protein